MQIAQKLAGYNLGEADLLRKACGKKKIELMNEEHSRFVFGNRKDYESGKAKHLIPGCVGNGIDEAVAEEIWSKMVKFASYAFNRSHAACYAYISILTAWLSFYYPCEFYAGMLNAFNDSTDKFVSYLAQINKRDIQVLPPDINLSTAKFSVDGDSIRFGLRGIKGMNKEALMIEREREANGPFKSFQDLYERMSEAGSPIEKKTFESLLYSGALDSFGHTRASLLNAFHLFVSGSNAEKKRVDGQISLFSGEFGKYSIIDIPDVKEIDKRTLMKEEHNVLGMYLSEHPVENYEKQMPKKYPFELLDDMQGENPRFGKVATVGLIRDLRHIFTKKGDLMYLFTLENKKTSIPCVVFPRSVPECQSALVENQIVLLNGDFTDNDDHGRQVIVSTMIQENNVMQEMFSATTKLFVPVNSKAEQDAALALAQKFCAKSESEGTQMFLSVGTDLYPKKKKLFIKLTMATLDEFLTKFPKAKLATKP